MPDDTSGDLRLRLRGLGLTDAAIDAAWPRWWSDDAEHSPSARADLRFGIARRLGLDPRTLFASEDEPRFMWSEEARFKHLRDEGELERSGIASFGRAVASILIAASPEPRAELRGVPANEIRMQLLASGVPYIGLGDLLVFGWVIGVPIAHLRVFPWPQKRMAAMAVSLRARSSILLGRDSHFPAPIAFYVAHELGHIALGHLKEDRLIVDLDDDETSELTDGDDEERAADAFALELLTGAPQPTVLSTHGQPVSGRELARACLASAEGLQIEPGMLAQCFGYSTGAWDTVNVALRHIYPDAGPVWETVNGIALRELRLRDVPQDAADFVLDVMGQAKQ